MTMIETIPATFVIGLGQLGTATCQQLAGDMRRIYGADVPLLRLLSIDVHPATPEEPDLHTHFTLPVDREKLLQWQANHPQPQTLPPVQAAAWRRAALSGNDDLPLFRPLERLAWFYALSGGANAPLQRLLQNALVNLRTHPDTGTTRTLLTLLVGHLSEPVGSSLAVDVSYLVQQVAADVASSLTIIPWGYTALPAAEASVRDKLAAAAALRELSRFTAPANHTRYGFPMTYQTESANGNGGGRFYNPPFDLWYCFDVAEPLPEITAALQPLLSKTAQDNLRTTKINRTGDNSYNESDSPFVGTVRVQSLYLPVRTLQQRWAHQDAIQHLERYQTLTLAASQIDGYAGAFWSQRNFPDSLQNVLQEQTDRLPRIVNPADPAYLVQRLGKQLFAGSAHRDWQTRIPERLESHLDKLKEASQYGVARLALRRVLSMLGTDVRLDDRNQPYPVDTYADVLDDAQATHLTWFDDILHSQLRHWQQTRRPRALSLQDVKQIVQQLLQTVQVRRTHYTQQADAHRQQQLFPVLSAFETTRTLLEDLLREPEPGFLGRLFNRDLQTRIEDFCQATREYTQVALTQILLYRLSEILDVYESRLRHLLAQIDRCQQQIDAVLAVLHDDQNTQDTLPPAGDVLRPSEAWVNERKRAYYTPPSDDDLARLHRWTILPADERITTSSDPADSLQIMLQTATYTWPPDAPQRTADYVRRQAARTYQQATSNLTVLDYLVNHCTPDEQAAYTAHLLDFPETLSIVARPTHQQSGFLVGIAEYKQQHVQFVSQQLIAPFSKWLGGQAISQVSHDDPQRLLQLLYVDGVSLKDDVPLYATLEDRYRIKRDTERIHAFRAEHTARQLELAHRNGQMLPAGVVDLLEKPQELLWFWIGERLDYIGMYSIGGRSNQKYFALRLQQQECMLTEPGDTRRGRAIRAFLAGEVAATRGADGVQQLNQLHPLRQALRQSYDRHINQRLVRWLSKPEPEDTAFLVQMGITRIQSVSAEKRQKLAEYQFFQADGQAAVSATDDALDLLKHLMLTDHANTLRNAARY